MKHLTAYLTHDEAAIRDAAAQAVEHAMQLGCDSASALVRASGGMRIAVRDGVPETASRENHQSLGLTVYRNGAVARVNTQSMAAEAIARAAQEAASLVRLIEPQADAGLPPAEWMAGATPSVELFAPDAPSTQELLDSAARLESDALNGKQMTNAWVSLHLGEASASAFDDILAVATSDGFLRSMMRSNRTRSVMVKAQIESGAQMGYYHSAGRRLNDLDSEEAVAQCARARAIEQLDPKNAPAGVWPVMFEARTSSALVGALTAALNGNAQYRGATIFPAALGERVLPAHLDLVEDPFEPFGLASGAFDTEGIAGHRRSIVDGGMIAGYFLDVLSARRLGLAPTGNAAGAYNLTLSSRASGGSRDEMLGRLGTGLVVTALRGGSYDPVSGVWTQAVSGYWVEKGERLHAVAGATLAGNLKDMLGGIVAVGSDVERSFAIRSGSILIASMTIGGR